MEKSSADTLMFLCTCLHVWQMVYVCFSTAKLPCFIFCCVFPHLHSFYWLEYLFQLIFVLFLFCFFKQMYVCMHLTIGGRRRFLGWLFDCGAIGAGNWTHSCWSRTSSGMGREWSTGCSRKLQWKIRKGVGNRQREWLRQKSKKGTN